MPWIDDNRCTGCGICVEECPVDVIWMENERANIDMNECIRCAICHDVCPTDAVRHDSEKENEIVKDNVNNVKRNIEACAKYLSEPDKWKCLERTIKHFIREKNIVEKTLQELEKLRKSQS
ncbi:4Fe-4S binding protein [candidate division WOR-3 bacterium]|nr:4Fe-4S binding protein [candidate division WOR-3 bacterium]MCK4529143.1 4Fe-4S binding protein [candidate division WOR-3 bacterium]